MNEIKKAQIIIEILKGELIAASCQKEPKISETIKSLINNLCELENILKKY